MSLEILRDARIRSVFWRDLVSMSRREIGKELLLPIPWITASLVISYFAFNWNYLFFPPALGLSFIFFLTGLRVGHDAFHQNLNVSAFFHDAILFVLSILMFQSMHAVRFNHLLHHKHCMDDEDVEAMSAKMSGIKAILWGPVFPVILHKNALKNSRGNQRFWIYAELAACAIWFGGVLFVFDISVLKYHLAAMILGNCLTAFFAVWTVHHDCDRSHFIARTLRNTFKSKIAFDMFFHVEHHLFPKVPTCHLPTLAERLDKVAPELQTKQVY